ncbi:MAG TPA: chemotaxis protein CheW [Polyangiaceae bacterium]|nr:chemotaxis protein CheW [Polyangiaceae bacterium]
MRQRIDPRKSLVGFVVGEVTYALEIGAVREVTNPLPVVALPQAPPAVVGVADYRGAIVPVVDLRAKFGLPSVAATRKTKWVIMDAGSRLVALVVDAVTEVFGLGASGVRQAPFLGQGDAERGIAGVAEGPSGMAFVLDEQSFAELVRSVSVARDASKPSPPVGGRRE